MKIAVGLCYYNDVESLKRGVPTYAPYADYVFAIDGRFEFTNGDDYSTDGATEYLEAWHNVIIERCVGKEQDKRNKYLELCERFKVDVLIIIDSDEYITDANWREFRKELEAIKDGSERIHNLKANYYGCAGYYPRVWTRPEGIRYWNTHNIITIDGRAPQRINSSTTNMLSSITLSMDDKLRGEDYLDTVYNYQVRMMEYERPYRKSIS